MKADRVVGCTRCACPIALVGDEVPKDGICPWCRAGDAPQVYALLAADFARGWKPGTKREDTP